MTTALHISTLPAVPPARPLVSLLSAGARPFYAVLAGALSLQGGPPLHFEEHEAALDRLLSGEAAVGAVCGLLYLRHHAHLDLLAAPVSWAARPVGRPVYHASVVVRRDGPFRAFAQLSGARWAVNERASFSGWVALLAELRRRGLPLAFLGEPTFTGSHLASLERLRWGLADASAVDSTVLDLAFAQDPALRRELRVVAQLGPYPAPPIVVHRDLPRPERARLLEALTALPHSEVGRSALALGRVTRFVPVREADYDPILKAERLAAPLLGACMPDAPSSVLLLDAGHHPQAPAFSHPDRTPDDAALLSAMLREVQAALQVPPVPRPGRRLFLFHPEALCGPVPLAFVGFRGERRPEVPEGVGAEVERIDAELVARMAERPDVLGYSCWQLPDGNWINLVLLQSLEAVQHWHQSGLHGRASAQLSPLYYASVRLHGGLLPGGVAGPVVVSRTKYYDFTAVEPWRAQRHFEGAPAR